MSSKSLPAMDAETRAAYFASNWGSKMYYKNEFGEFSHDWDSPHFEKNVKNSSSYLLLTPLHLISDDQIKQMCLEADEMPFSGNSHLSKWIVERNTKGFAKVSYDRNIYSFSVDLTDGEVDVYMEGELITSANNRAVADYLRKEGFAIGFRKWSVDQLVELGVLRLKEK